MSEAHGEAEVVVNERTGERVTFVSETPELLSMLVEWPRPGRRAVEDASALLSDFADEITLPS